MTEATPRMNWARAFARLRTWPLSVSKADLLDQTPRETFELWRQLNELSLALSQIAERSNQELGPGERSEPAPVFAAPAREERPDGAVPISGGLGLESDDCFKPYPGEVSTGPFGGDPFSVPRDLARERWYTMVLRIASEGQLEHYGVTKGNFAAARDFFATTWENNSRIFDKIVGAMKADGESGRAVFLEMGQRGELENYQVPRGDEGRSLACYEHLKACWAKHQE